LYAESRDYKSPQAKWTWSHPEPARGSGDFSGSRHASSLVPHPPLTYSQFKVHNRTETLEVGSRAPEFALPSANWEGSIFTLSTMLGRGPVVVEFLRGTW
jgi:hypothetical protein